MCQPWMSSLWIPQAKVLSLRIENYPDKKRGETQRLTIEEMQKIAEIRGGKCLSPIYKNSVTKLKWQCKKGHQWFAAPSKIKFGQWCPICAGKTLKIIKKRDGSN